VDLVAVSDAALQEAALQEEEDPTRDTPYDLEALLHEDLPVAHRAPSEPQPFTWRGALYVLNVLERPLAKPLSALKLDKSFVSRLHRPGRPAKTILAEFDEHFAKFAGRWDIKAHRAALATFLEQHPTPDAIIDHLREAYRRYLAWRVSACERLTRERASILTHDLDTLMPAAAWQALKKRLQRNTFRYFTTRKVSIGGKWRHVVVEERIGVFPDRYMANFELVADYYVDARLRTLIPPAVLSKFEPYYRCLVNNLPHRMGGYHDVDVQWGNPTKPTEDLKLFQIASDGAMNWWWADVGAYYVVIDKKSLQKGDFSKARLYIDTH
jgi:hypothetical protein